MSSDNAGKLKRDMWLKPLPDDIGEGRLLSDEMLAVLKKIGFMYSGNPRISDIGYLFYFNGLSPDESSLLIEALLTYGELMLNPNAFASRVNEEPDGLQGARRRFRDLLGEGSQ